MQLMSLLKLVVYTSLLMSYAPAAMAMAMTETSNGYLYFGLGLFSGGLFTFCLFLYLNRHHRDKYEKLLARLKTTQKDTEIAKEAMQALAKEQQDSNDLLEERVQERTIELNITLQELESANQELERKNILDELTGLHNRRFYDQKILAEYRRSRRNLTALSLVVIDIDHFKSVNDNYGHLTGDHCLVWLAKHINKSLKRSTDKAFRYGGEEFCLILPDTDAQGALIIAEKLRTKVCEEAFRLEDNEIALTISCGISTYQQQADVGPEELFSGADKALYQAKHSGRNQTQQHIFVE